MNGNVEEEAPRPRPLSAGIWTLFSWLRRPDRSSSSESISSVGSDRTVASFDFLAPLNLKHVPPLVLTQGPLTDTYKKRLDERNLRRQRDRDLTLHRKYGLFREEGVGYDAFSLPTARRLQNRERRAASESIQRRSAYVPGKRRAPLPPTVIVSATLPRNYKRKRPAPKPPVKISEENKENVSSNKIIQMNSTSDVEKHSFLSKDTCSEKSIQTKTEKNSKLGTKDVKLRTDKSFLKHLFDNKKRNSAIDTSHIKLLPSISELDKQAAEIIEANKSLRASGGNNIKYIDSDSRSASVSEESWICTTCLRKYKPVVSCCIYCIIKENSSNDKNVTTKVSNICTQTDVNVLKSIRKNEIDEKKKLREMLKEMKDSLPKRPKHNNKHNEESSSSTHIITSSETPTLRIGSSIDDNVKINLNSNNSEKERQCNLTKNAKEAFLTSQPSTSKQQLVNISSNTALVSANPSFIKPRSPTVNDLRKKVPLLKESHDSTKKFSATNIVNKNLIRNHDNTLGDCVRGDFRVINALLDNKVAQSKVNVVNTRNSSTENVKEKDLLVKLSNNNSENRASIVEKSVDKIFSKILVIPHNNDRSSVLPSQACEGTDVKNKMEKVHLGNVVSPLAVSIEQVAFSKNPPDDSKTDLHTPMKISSLLNPLYCPKAKMTNVSDCNFANILTTNDKKVESNKKEDKTSNEQKVLPNITLPTPILSINVHTPSTSNIKQVDLKKSEATEVSRATCENMPTAKDNVAKGKNIENVTADIAKDNASSCGKILDNYNRRRNLINQLEQAISKGDEQSAADAAAKLAKLKLACSVLSFSSQIVAETTPNKIEHLKNKITIEENNTKPHIDNNPSSNTKVSSSLLSETGLKRLNLKNQEDDQKDQKTNAKTIHNQINIATTSTSIHIPDKEILPIEVWVEDKEAARGPIPLRIGKKAMLGELKREVEMSLGLEIRLQRWIVGRTLCTDDNTQLATLAGPDLNAPFYLCLVESETNNSLQIKEVAPVPNTADPSEINNVAPGDFYTELMKLERQALVPNTEEFECGVCIEQCEVGAGAVLRECIHTFCRECLADVVRHCEEPLVACPAIECPGTLQEREIRALLSTEEYERWLARGLAAAESGTRNTFHCRTRDCKGWAFCEPGVRRFPCPVCRHTNCVSCQAVHEGETCEQHQAKLREAVSAAETNQTDEGTQALLKSLISRGEALECPECSAIITKKWGCDWIKCSACKTEICWVTRGRRWGPGGKGDTSGGCRCGVEGKRCHPSCGYCH